MVWWWWVKVVIPNWLSRYNRHGITIFMSIMELSEVFYYVLITWLIKKFTRINVWNFDMSECSPKFIKYVLRQVNIRWIACIFSVSCTALVNTHLPHFWIAPLIITCYGSVLMWSQGVKHSSIHRRMLVRLELKSVTWEAVYDWIWMSGQCRFGSGRINWIDRDQPLMSEILDSIV